MTEGPPARSGAPRLAYLITSSGMGGAEQEVCHLATEFRRRGWAVAGLVIIVVLAGLVLSFVVTAVLGTLFLLVGGRDGLGPLLVLILNSALTAVFTTVVIVLFAAIYRAVAGAAEPTTGT